MRLDPREVTATLRRAGDLARAGLAVRRIRRARRPEERERARTALAQLLGGIGGLAMKAGQIAASLPDGEAYGSLVSGVRARPLSALRPQMERSLGRTLESVFRDVAEDAVAASIGQVHRATLHDGTRVAVKVRYPGIDRDVRAELRLAGWVPGGGPPRAFGFDLDGYRRLLARNASLELDYLTEASRQERFRGAVRLPRLVVPTVFRDLCRPDLLVQSWEEGVSLSEAARFPKGDRLLLGQAILRAFFTTLFVTGEIHADPHPGNLLLRRAPGGPELVLLDFGCLLVLQAGRRMALLRLLHALRAGDAASVPGCLDEFGFDTARLAPISGDVVAACRLLLEPWLAPGPFSLSTWRLSERTDELLGDRKWWLRSAAPPDILLLIRALLGVQRQLEMLDVRLPWWPIVEDVVPGELKAEARRAGATSGAPPPAPIQGSARCLRVRIVECGSETTTFDASFPAEEALALESSLPDAIRQKVAGTGVALGSIVRRLERTGLAPQEIFATRIEGRAYRVWLE